MAKGKQGNRGWVSAAAIGAVVLSAMGCGQKRAWAQSTSRPPLEVSIFTGNSFTARSDLFLKQPAKGTDVVFHDMEWQARPFSSSYYYGYRLGTFLPHAPRLGFEADLLHYKVYAKVNEHKRETGTWQNQVIDEVALVRDRVQEFRITNGVNVLTLGMMYRVPLLVSPAFPNGRVQPYVGGGPAYYILYAINSVGGEANPNRGYHSGGWGYVAQTGVRYGLTRNFSLFGEGRYNNGTADVGIIEGRGHTHLSTTHLIGGATVRF